MDIFIRICRYDVVVLREKGEVDRTSARALVVNPGRLCIVLRDRVACRLFHGPKYVLCIGWVRNEGEAWRHPYKDLLRGFLRRMIGFYRYARYVSL